jgi:hypothetical protein
VGKLVASARRASSRQRSTTSNPYIISISNLPATPRTYSEAPRAVGTNPSPDRIKKRVREYWLRCKECPKDFECIPDYAMNGTPRLRSSWPSTPGSDQNSPESRDDTRGKSPLPNLPETSSTSAASNEPVIPVTLVDAPSQRMYTVAVYGLLLVWCLYDWWKLVEDDTTSLGLFLKWTCIHAIFLYGVPQLRIPWLEWSETTSHFALMAHAGLNGMLMFRVPVRPSIY